MLAPLIGCTAAAAPQAPQPAAQQAGTLAASLHGSGSAHLHIFYIHGIGAGGPNDYDSQQLRTSICKYLRDCTTAAGTLTGTDYADRGAFALNAAPPKETYMGEPVWKRDSPNGPSREWNASAPYVDHWKLERRNAPTIYVDEINWWPLVSALKCRQLIAPDAELAGPARQYLSLCSQSEPDAAHPGRYRLYPWIDPAEARRLAALPSHAALVNRILKTNLLDWGFSDAVFALGPMQPLLLEGIRELIVASIPLRDDGTPVDPSQANQEFIIAAHSLGSYLIFAALDLKPAPQSNATLRNWQRDFQFILSRTASVYFFANQIRLLEMANLDVNGDMVDHLRAWALLRRQYLASQPGLSRSNALPQLISWSDPSDLLTWDVPALKSNSGETLVVIRNRHVRNGRHWFWLIEGPTGAHDNYAKDKRMIREMFRLPASTEP